MAILDPNSLARNLFGQTGPDARKSAFTRIGEALSGLAYICGGPDGTPMHLCLPIADAVAGMAHEVGSAAMQKNASGWPPHA